MPKKILWNTISSVPHNNLFDHISEYFNAPFWVNHTSFKDDLLSSIFQSSGRDHLVNACADVYSDLHDYPKGTPTVTMTVKCTCSRYCKVQLRLIHHHLEENVTVQSGEHTDHPSDGQRGVEKLHLHPTIRRHIAENVTTQPKLLLSEIKGMHKEAMRTRKISATDGRYLIDLDGIRNLVKSRNDKPPSVVMQTIINNYYKNIISHTDTFNPESFALLIFEDFTEIF